METQMVPPTNLFKKCRILSQNPVYKELFLVLKKKGFYCINVKNKSIKKVPFYMQYDMFPISFSSNGEHFIIIVNTTYNNNIYVFDSKTLYQVNSFGLSDKINMYGSVVSYNDIDMTHIDFYVVYNEYLVCNVEYSREPYRRHEYSPELLDTGIEVYNIITGELVANSFTIKCGKLYITDNILYCIMCNKTKDHYGLTPHLELTCLVHYPELPRPFQHSPKYYFGSDSVYFSVKTENNENKLYSCYQNNKGITTTAHINLNFKFPSNNIIIENMIHVPRYNCFMVGTLYYHFSIRILVLNNDMNKCLFHFDINASRSFFVLDDGKIIYDLNDRIYSIETPLNTLEYFKTSLERHTEYFLPDELIDRLIYFF